ncbi:phosphoheptose isomerase [Candidatus Planktophila lacus]|uniref:Mannose-6-phosphate isomerase n=1 Tax=Candidatus Planktophila lacus TaxID=1884913 RepID=A0AAC9YRG2_9ACTN|nr:phosphoheptose isomerase [Candidatus Planktophila lacus]ASY11216.1 mannose-6-phosphate isomerase [Candidatus Planktophila lacus]
MSQSSTTPSKLPSNQFDHFYRGGNRIGALRHGPGGPMRPEEWIGSITTRFGEAEQGLSRLSDGTLLRDAIKNDSDGWLGADHVKNFGLSTEILIKLLDPDQRLPVHYHPNKAFAKTHLGLDHGKTEAWIILEAPTGSGVGLGFAQKQNKEDLLKLVRAQDSAALLASLRRTEVQVGDAVLVPAGVAHAIDAGIFVLELQEPTDLSALLEWEGFAVDGIKDGHLGLGFEIVTDALMLDPLSDSEFDSLITHNVFSGGALRSVLPLKSDGYFRAHLAPGSGDFPAGFAVALVLDGSGSISFASAPEMAITKGDAIVIPHSAGAFAFSGANAVVCRPPLAELARVAP